MNQVFLLLLLISHVIGDGFLGSKKFAELKRDSRFSYRLIAVTAHTIPHALIAGLLMLLVGYPWLKVALLVFVLHFLIDFIRCQVDMKLFGIGGLNFSETLSYALGVRRDDKKPDGKTLRTWSTINILDQTAHVASLYAIAKMVY